MMQAVSSAERGTEADLTYQEANDAFSLVSSDKTTVRDIRVARAPRLHAARAGGFASIAAVQFASAIHSLAPTL